MLEGEIPGSQHPFAESVQDAFNYSGIEKLDQIFPFELIEQWGLIPQKLPASFNIREDETFMAYQDRLNHSFRIPTYHGGLNELKTGFTEVIQPLLLDQSIELFRSIPDDYRTHKLIVKKIVAKLNPKIGFASSDSLEKHESIIRRPEVIQYMEEILNQSSSSKFLSQHLIDFILNNIDKRAPSSQLMSPSLIKKLKNFIKVILPTYLKLLIKRIIHWNKNKAKTIDVNKMALRACIIIKMNETLNDTAKNPVKKKVIKVEI